MKEGGERLLAASNLRNGQVEVTTGPLARGRHTISASYTGDDSYKPATAAFDVKIKRKPA